MSEDTKKRIRTVLVEHMGPGAEAIGDQDDLSAHAARIEWVNITVALENEFDLLWISEFVLEKCVTIDQMARFIDTLIASRTASPH